LPRQARRLPNRVPRATPPSRKPQWRVRFVGCLALLPVILLHGCVPPDGSEAHPPTEEALYWDSDLNRAFTVLEEPEEWIEAFLEPSPLDDRAVLARTLAEIFPDRLPEDDESVALAILDFVAQTIRLEYTDTPSGAEVLKQGHAYCNGMALAFVALCREAGLPARVNAFHNLTDMQGHNMAEVYYDGDWRLFDPTYNVFFYTAADYGAGEVLSLRTLAAHDADRWYCFQLSDALWTGEQVPYTAVERLAADARYGYPYPLYTFFDTLFREANPIVMSEYEAASFPIRLDFSESEEIWLGERDRSIESVFDRQDDGTYPRFQGYPFLGATRIGAAFHTFSIAHAEPGRYRMTYYLTGSGSQDYFQPVELKNVVVGGAEILEKAWSMRFALLEDQGILLVANRLATGYIDAIHVERIGPLTGPVIPE